MRKSTPMETSGVFDLFTLKCKTSKVLKTLEVSSKWISKTQSVYRRSSKLMRMAKEYFSAHSSARVLDCLPKPALGTISI